MKITINNQEFETNPTGINSNLVFLGTVHSGTGKTETVFGFTEQQVIDMAKELQKLNKDFNTVHIYGPCNNGSKRTYIGVRFLNH
jgi:hypothetical protein